MYFLLSKKDRSDFWSTLLCCFLAALILAVVVSFIASFWVGWFTAAAFTWLGLTLGGLFVFFILASIAGLGVAFLWIGALAEILSGMISYCVSPERQITG